MSMDLTQLTGAPELVVTIAGEEYGFSELTLDALGRLQSWIRAHTPDPWEDAKRRVRGLPDAVAASILDSARKEALKWPPKVKTPDGTRVLLADDEGQVEVFFEALRVHRPGTTREEAREICHALNREPGGEDAVDRIFRVLFDWVRRPWEASSKNGVARTTDPRGV